MTIASDYAIIRVRRMSFQLTFAAFVAARVVIKRKHYSLFFSRREIPQFGLGVAKGRVEWASE